MQFSPGDPGLFLCHLPFFHPVPADIAVNIVHQKHDKADHYGKIGNILHRRQPPEDDQDDIIGGIGEGKIRTSSESEIHSKKTCCNR